MHRENQQPIPSNDVETSAAESSLMFLSRKRKASDCIKPFRSIRQRTMVSSNRAGDGDTTNDRDHDNAPLIHGQDECIFSSYLRDPYVGARNARRDGKLMYGQDECIFLPRHERSQNQGGMQSPPESTRRNNPKRSSRTLVSQRWGCPKLPIPNAGNSLALS